MQENSMDQVAFVKNPIQSGVIKLYWVDETKNRRSVPTEENGHFSSIVHWNASIPKLRFFSLLWLNFLLHKWLEKLYFIQCWSSKLCEIYTWELRDLGMNETDTIISMEDSTKMKSYGIIIWDNFQYSLIRLRMKQRNCWDYFQNTSRCLHSSAYCVK